MQKYEVIFREMQYYLSKNIVIYTLCGKQDNIQKYL